MYSIGIVADITPGVVDFYREPLRVGDRITTCPDVVCGKCYNCRHIFAYSWCENWRGYGNSFRATEEPLMGGWGEYLVIIPVLIQGLGPLGLCHLIKHACMTRSGALPLSPRTTVST